MVERSRIRLLTGALASVLLPGLAGCAWPPYERLPLRPPHYYDYYYYPHTDVYFHIYTGWYYYHDHVRWRRGRRLPPHIRLDWRHRHLLNIREKEPWRRHDEHRRKYPPPPDFRRPDFRREEKHVPGPRPAPSPAIPRTVPPPGPGGRAPPPEPRRRPEREVLPQRPERRPAPEIRRPEPPSPAAAPPERLFEQERRLEQERLHLQERDRQEREHNIRRHREYRDNPWSPPRD